MAHTLQTWALRGLKPAGRPTPCPPLFTLVRLKDQPGILILGSNNAPPRNTELPDSHFMLAWAQDEKATR